MAASYTLVDAAPAFQFYGRDFLIRTAALSLELRGALVTLQIHAWFHGAIPRAPAACARILGCDVAAGRRVLRGLRAFLVECDGGLVDPVLEAERSKQLERRLIAAENGAKGGRPKKQTPGNPAHENTQNGNRPVSPGFPESKPKPNPNESSAFAFAFASAIEDPPLPPENGGPRLPAKTTAPISLRKPSIAETAWANQLRSTMRGCPHTDDPCTNASQCVGRLVMFRRATQRFGMEQALDDIRAASS